MTSHAFGVWLPDASERLRRGCQEDDRNLLATEFNMHPQRTVVSKRGKTMRYLGLLLGAAGLVFCGCGGDDGGSDNNNSTDTYTVGGTLTGLVGAVVLQNNAGDDLTLSGDGATTFATPVADTTAYAVTVLTHPHRRCLLHERLGQPRRLAVPAQRLGGSRRYQLDHRRHRVRQCHDCRWRGRLLLCRGLRQHRHREQRLPAGGGCGLSVGV